MKLVRLSKNSAKQKIVHDDDAAGFIDPVLLPVTPPHAHKWSDELFGDACSSCLDKVTNLYLIAVSKDF